MKILIATNNPAKVREIIAVLNDGATGVEWRSLADLGKEIPEPIEDGATFAENAALKARYYSNAAGMWALADDSGLEVDALNGEPGVHSAYYARNVADRPRAERDAANNAKLIASLKGVPPEKRTARFRCYLALADADRIITTAEGSVEGVIIDAPRGTGGFGYDPHFFIPEMGKTTAELSSPEKNQISHRGRALRDLKSRLRRLMF
ncbi:MAG: RdgB/HAM1 family non-canonical purine NTP pyrophosphatase [Planctomycetes bacterium]|nr:RdgB/HAM1 family non-canonical purine NTP pyrophosphatase [Planctomycetota bacterium]